MDGVERRKERNRQKIRRAAAELFKKRGVNRARMFDIARKARVSHVTIYNLFGSKERLVVDCLTIMGDQLIEDLRLIANTDKSYYERAEDIVQAMVGVTGSIRGIADVNAPISGDLQLLQDSLSQRFRDLFVEFIKKGQKEGCCNRNLSVESIEACVEILVRGITADAEMRAKVQHDPKLFHDVMSIILSGLGLAPLSRPMSFGNRRR